MQYLFLRASLGLQFVCVGCWFVHLDWIYWIKLMVWSFRSIAICRNLLFMYRLGRADFSRHHSFFFYLSAYRPKVEGYFNFFSWSIIVIPNALSDFDLDLGKMFFRITLLLLLLLCVKKKKLLLYATFLLHCQSKGILCLEKRMNHVY